MNTSNKPAFLPTALRARLGLLALPAAVAAFSACSGSSSSNDTSSSSSGNSGSYSVGGTVSGQNASGLKIKNTVDSYAETLNIASTQTKFTFEKTMTSGKDFAVTVVSTPSGQTCSISNGSGRISGNVTNVAVTCQ